MWKIAGKPEKPQGIKRMNEISDDGKRETPESVQLIQVE